MSEMIAEQGDKPSDKNEGEKEREDENDIVVEKMSIFPLPTHHEPISDDPAKIHSHFCRVSEANRKGQARFQCLKCGHEFECSGRKRLIQHIIGYSHQANRYKNVRACNNPHMPLKETLMSLYPKHVVPDGEKKKRRRRRKEEMLAAKLMAEMHKNRSVGEFGESVVADDFYRDAKRRAIEGSSPLSMTLASPFLLPPSDQAPPKAMHYFANQTLYQLLANHGLSVSLVDDPLFVEFLNAVRMAGDDYSPSMQSVVQDNILSLLLTNSSSHAISSLLPSCTENATSATLSESDVSNNNDNNNNNNNIHDTSQSLSHAHSNLLFLSGVAESQR